MKDNIQITINMKATENTTAADKVVPKTEPNTGIFHYHKIKK